MTYEKSNTELKAKWEPYTVFDEATAEFELHLACTNCNPKKKPTNTVYICTGGKPKQPNYCPNCGAKMIKSRKICWEVENI